MSSSLYLHSNREVILSLHREEDINSFLGEGLIALRRLSHLNDMQLDNENTGIYM